MTTDLDETFLFDEQGRAEIRRMAEFMADRERRAAVRHEAEMALVSLRDTLRGRDDQIPGLVARLRSGEPGELTADEVALAADALEAESMHLTLSDLRDIDPFPGAGPQLIDASMLPAFDERHLPRLQKLYAEVRK